MYIVNDPVTRESCPRCDRTFAAVWSLLDHLDRSHADEARVDLWCDLVDARVAAQARRRP